MDGHLRFLGLKEMREAEAHYIIIQQKEVS